MTEETPTPDPRYAHPAVRPDDARGAKPGTATMVQEHGGRIGQAPFVPTDEQREQVREYAKVFPPAAEKYIARLMGFSRDTLRKYFADDMEMGRAVMLAKVGKNLVDAAEGKIEELTRADRDAQKFIMARMGGWSNKVEMTGRDGGPIEHRTFDTSHLTDEQRQALVPVLDQLLGDRDQGGNDA